MDPFLDPANNEWPIAFSRMGFGRFEKTSIRIPSTGFPNPYRTGGDLFSRTFPRKIAPGIFDALGTCELALQEFRVALGKFDQAGDPRVYI
jgi:hypothetical protein